jgi:hypothetical protein
MIIWAVGTVRQGYPYMLSGDCPSGAGRRSNRRARTMQNRYVGDIGDYLKFGILRALSPGYRLGVAWWLFPDEAHNGDGRHIGYLSRPDQWRHFDPELFDSLRDIVLSGRRSVRELEMAAILPGTTFASEFIPTGGATASRQQARQDWLETVRRKLEPVDLLFLDPDNGLEPAGFRPTAVKSGKSIMIGELHQLARPGRCVIVYHHQSRRTGGHDAEMQHWAGRLRTSGFTAVDALRAKPFSPRLYFLLDAPPLIRQRAERTAFNWQDCITWHPSPHTDAGRI